MSTAKRLVSMVVAVLIASVVLAADVERPAAEKQAGAEVKTARKEARAGAKADVKKKTPRRLQREKKRAAAKRRAALKALRRQLEKRRKMAPLKFDKTPLTDALEQLGQRGKFLVVIDPQLEKDEIYLYERKVTLKIPPGRMSYAQILDMILGEDLGYRVEPGRIFITTLDKSWLPLMARQYPARFLIAEAKDHIAPRFDINNVIERDGQGQGGGGGFFAEDGADVEDDDNALTPERLVELCEKYVNSDRNRKVARWQSEGGPASISFFRGRLVVTQTYEGHVSLTRFLLMIR